MWSGREGCSIYGLEPVQRVGVRYGHGEKEVQNVNSLYNEQRISKELRSNFWLHLKLI